MDLVGYDRKCLIRPEKKQETPLLKEQRKKGGTYGKRKRFGTYTIRRKKSEEFYMSTEKKKKTKIKKEILVILKQKKETVSLYVNYAWSSYFYFCNSVALF